MTVPVDVWGDSMQHVISTHEIIAQKHEETLVPPIWPTVAGDSSIQTGPGEDQLTPCHELKISKQPSPEFAMTLNQEVTTLKQTNQAENLERARILQQMLNDHMTALMKSEQSRECEAARQANELADYLAKLMNRVSSMRKSNQQENLASRSGWLRGAVSV